MGVTPSIETFALSGNRVLLEDRLQPATLVVREGRFTEILPRANTADVDLDVGDLLVFPGLVDSHVHVNEPGRTNWEGFETATRAAAAGGITTLIDMPLNAVPATTTIEGLRAKQETAARRSLAIDVGFWAGVVPGNQDAVETLATEGVLGFKAFLVDSGVAEFPPIGFDELERRAPALAALGLPLLVHAEDPRKLRDLPASGVTSYAEYLASRPSEAESSAIEFLIDISRRSGLRVHIVHLATESALEPLERARREGVPITVETCPHYLAFAAEEIKDRATAFKCAPPIRSSKNREALWRGLESGHIDLIASDHSPAPPSLKHLEDGDFAAAWGGIASLELTLAVVWTGARRRNVPVERIATWMSSAPARLAGLADRKGCIAPGHDADLCIWDPDQPHTVRGAALEQRHPTTPYEGASLFGRVERTYCRGRLVYARGAACDRPEGLLLGSKPDSGCLSLAEFNRLDAESARRGLEACCGSQRWTAGVAAARPFSNLEHLCQTADQVWSSLAAEDWLEAFAAHPRIGDKDGGAQTSSAWSQKEQAGALAAGNETKIRLAEGNRRYEERFGHIFLICATGKNADEMLSALETRLQNSSERELEIAASEQSKITRLRLEKWLYE